MTYDPKTNSNILPHTELLVVRPVNEAVEEHPPVVFHDLATLMGQPLEVAVSYGDWHDWGKPETIQVHITKHEPAEPVRHVADIEVELMESEERATSGE